MVLVGVDRRLLVKILRRFIRQSFLQGLKWATHFRALIAQIEEKYFVEFCVRGKEVLRLVQGDLVVPPQAGTGRDIGLKHIGSSNENVNRQPLHQMLRREKSGVNHKRVYRLYREEGLAMRRGKSKRFRAEAGLPLVLPRRANQMWTMDFTWDTLASGRTNQMELEAVREGA